MTTPQTVPMLIPKWLSDEVFTRMDEKLSIIKLKPQIIWQSGASSSSLSSRYPAADIYVSEKQGLYPSFKKYLYGFLKKPVPHFFDAKSELQGAKFDFIFSNLELQRAGVEILIAQWRKLLKPNSLLMLSYLGPDTGKNLNSLLGLDTIRENLALDMHDVGDVLLSEGFSEPVMDMEYLTLDYENLDLLIKDALMLGLIHQKDLQLIDRHKINGPLQIILEVVYGHAWIPEINLSKTKDGLARIGIDQIGRSKNK